MLKASICARQASIVQSGIRKPLTRSMPEDRRPQRFKVEAWQTVLVQVDGWHETELLVWYTRLLSISASLAVFRRS